MAQSQREIQRKALTSELTGHVPPLSLQNATTALPEDESRKFEPVKSGGAQVRSNKQGFGFSLVKRFYNFITKLKTIWQKGMQMWEELEDQYLSELSKPNKVKSRLQNMGLDGLVVIGRVDSDTNACLLAENSRTLWWLDARRLLVVIWNARRVSQA